MKAKLERLTEKKPTQSFVCYKMSQPSFGFFWHYHPEYELTYIVSGEGKRLVGNNYEEFQAGDLVLLGPNLPHTWISDKKTKQRCKAIVIQFSKEFIGPFLQYEELKEIKKLLQKSEKGIQFLSKKNEDINLLMQQIVRLSNMNKLFQLLVILQKLTTIKSVQLNAVTFSPIKEDINQHRINKVFQYVQSGFRHTISLQKAATLLHLSKSAFCKYFKRISGKTFSDYVNEIRIANACQLLIETDKPVSQIAFNSGFESLTYFNRVFYKKKYVTPKKFRELG